MAEHHSSSARAIYYGARQLGASLGVTLVVLLIDRRAAFHSSRLIDSLFSRNLTTLGVTTDPQTALAARRLAGAVLKQSLVLTYADVFYAMAALAAVTLFFLPLLPSFNTPQRQPAALGLLNVEQDHSQSRAARMRALSVLLPQLSAEAAEVFRNFPVNTIGGQKLGLPGLISNFNYQTAAVNYRQSIVNISALHEVKAAHQEAEMSTAALTDSLNIVVLAATSTYLEVAASQSRGEGCAVGTGFV